MNTQLTSKLIELATDRNISDLNAAVVILEAAVKIDSESLEVLHALADAYHKKNDIENALLNYCRCLEINPCDVESLYVMGNIEMELGKYSHAVDLYNKALSIVEFPEAYINLGSAYSKIGNDKKYYEILINTSNKYPDYWISHYNLGVYYYENEKISESILYYRRALEINTSERLVKFSLSLALLKNKDYAEGFKLYENRWGVIPMCPIRDLKPEVWLGEAVSCSYSIVVTTEQGFGDFIQMSRYLPLLSDKFTTVYVEVQTPMLRLAQILFPDFKIIKYGDAIPDVKYHIPLMSLPFAFGTLYDTVPQSTVYEGGQFDGQYDKNCGTALRVGICWKGSQDNPQMRHRSFALEDLLPILKFSNINFVSLVKEPSTDECLLLRDSNIIDSSERMSDFYDTYRIISELDVVISVDTSVAHLSAAMGKRTLILLNSSSDWRWHMHDQTSPWYPTARLYRFSTDPDHNTKLLESISDTFMAVNS